MSSTKKRVVWLLTILLATLVLAVLIADRAYRRRIHISQAACDQLEKGMTEQDVESITGVPPGNYNNGLLGYLIGQESATVMMTITDCSRREWTGDEGQILCFFNKEGKLVYKHWTSFR